MIFRLSRPVIHAEVDAGMRLSLEGFMNHFQEAAIAHADSAGFGSERTRAEQTAWLLHRAGIEILREPVVGEELEIATWITGSAGSRARRSFEARVADETVARAAYVWVYFDTIRKMPRRIDAEMDVAFRPEGGEPAVAGVEDIGRFAIAEPSFASDITLRATDFDSNEHVNNSIYATFVETLLYQRGETRRTGRMVVCFQREIGRGLRAVAGRLEDREGGCRFTIETPGVVNAFGELSWRNQP